MQHMGYETVILFCKNAKSRDYRIFIFGHKQKLDKTLSNMIWLSTLNQFMTKYTTGPDDHQRPLCTSVILCLCESALTSFKYPSE